MNAGRLEIEIAAGIARLQKDLGDAKGQLTSFARDAERIMKGAALSIGAAFGAMLGAISFDAIIKAAHEGEKSMLRLDAVIKATGSSAGYSRAQIDALADSLADVTQFTDEGFKDAAANIIRFGNVSGEQFQRTLKAAADLAAFTSTDVPAAAETLAKALASPAQGVERLQRTIGYLDKAQIDAIKTMVEMGDTVGAQNAILEIMEKRLGGVAEAMNTGYTKAISDAKKATDEFFEAIGRSTPVQATTTSFLTFVADTFKDLKKIIEEGDWVEKALRLLAFAGGWRGVGNPTSGGGGGPGDGGAAAAQAEADRIKAIRAGIDEQDDRLIKIALERQKKAAEERLKIAFEAAQAQLKADEMFADDYREAWKYADEARNKEAKDAAAEREFLAKQESEGDAEFARIYAEAWKYANQQILAESRAREREERALWEGLSDVFGTFFSDLVMNGKSAFDNLKKFAKDLLAQMIALFAKRWVLNMAAGGTVMGSAGSAMAGGIGSDSLAGGVLNAAGSYVGGYLASGVGTAAGLGTAGSMWAAAGAGVTATETGLAVSTGALAGEMGALYTTLASIPVWGWIAMAVIAIGAWIAGNHKGGDKVGGSFFTGGAVPGTDNGRFFTPNQADPALQEAVLGLQSGYGNLAGRLGGTAGAFNFGLGFDHDPQGTQESRVSAMLTGADGSILYRMDNLGMDDKQVPAALSLEMKRMLVTALQNTDLDDELDALFDVFDVTKANAEDIDRLLAQAVEMKGIIDTLAQWDIGLTVKGLQMMAREGETLGATFNAIAQGFMQYRQLFFSAEENHDFGMGQMVKEFEKLGIALPKTREEFRALVEGIDKSTEAGARLWRRLIELAPAFADLVPAIEDVDDAVEDMATTTAAATQLFAAAVGQIVSGVNDPLTLYAQGKPARQGLGEYLDNLASGPMAPIGKDQQLREALRQYQETLALAQAGDVGAIGRLSGIHGNALSLYRQIYGAASSQTASFYQRSFNEMAAIAQVPNLQERATKATEDLLKRVSDNADRQEALLEQIQQDQRTSTDMIVSAVNSNGERVARAVEAAPLGQR